MKTNLHKMLTNPFYIGQFEWGGHTYRGVHPSLITPELYARAQAVLNGGHAPSYCKHDIAFRGMLSCAYDNSTVTAELKKNKYVYYRCSGGRGPCELPRFREQEIAEKLGDVLRGVSIPAEVVRTIEESLGRVQEELRDKGAQERARLGRELSALHARMDAAYTDKLDGKISAEFWQRKQADWESKELRIKSLISSLNDDKSDERLLNARRILELAKDAYFLYVTQKTSGTGRIA